MEIPDDDPIFHTVYELNDRYQVPGYDHRRLGYKRPCPEGPEDGKGAHWRGIYDDKGRFWWPSPTTRTSAMPGSGPTTPAIRRNSRTWPSAWA